MVGTEIEFIYKEINLQLHYRCIGMKMSNEIPIQMTKNTSFLKKSVSVATWRIEPFQ